MLSLASYPDGIAFSKSPGFALPTSHGTKRDSDRPVALVKPTKYYMDKKSGKQLRLPLTPVLEER